MDENSQRSLENPISDLFKRRGNKCDKRFSINYGGQYSPTLFRLSDRSRSFLLLSVIRLDCPLLLLLRTRWVIWSAHIFHAAMTIEILSIVSWLVSNYFSSFSDLSVARTKKKIDRHARDNQFFSAVFSTGKRDAEGNSRRRLIDLEIQFLLFSTRTNNDLPLIMSLESADQIHQIFMKTISLGLASFAVLSNNLWLASIDRRGKRGNLTIHIDRSDARKKVSASAAHCFAQRGSLGRRIKPANPFQRPE